MVEHFPEYIDPLALVEKRCQFKGNLPLSKMTRLHDWLASDDGVVAVDLDFGREGRVAAITGRVAAKLQLQCQCCMGSIEWPVASPINLGVVRSLDEADRLPDHFEPLLLDGEVLALLDIVQDELLLAMPSIPQHEQCESVSQSATITAPEKPTKPNPFAVLAKLKQE